MAFAIRAVVGLLLIAHGLVHLLYLAPEADDRTYPFTLRESWLVPEPSRRPVALALIVATVAAFVVLGLAVWGVPWLSTVWPVIGVIAAAASLTLLIAFWDIQLITAVVIDLGIIGLAVLRPDWTDQISG